MEKGEFLMQCKLFKNRLIWTFTATVAVSLGFVSFFPGIPEITVTRCKTFQNLFGGKCVQAWMTEDRCSLSDSDGCGFRTTWRPFPHSNVEWSSSTTDTAEEQPTRKRSGDRKKKRRHSRMETNDDEQKARRSASKSWGDERDCDAADLPEGNVDLLERLPGVKHTVPRSRLKKAMKILSATRTLEPLHPSACECRLKCYTGVQVADVVAHRVTILNVMPPTEAGCSAHLVKAMHMALSMSNNETPCMCGKARRCVVSFFRWWLALA